MTQGYTRVPSMAALSGKSCRSRGHREKGCQNQQSRGTSVHLWRSQPTCTSAFTKIMPDETHDTQCKMPNNTNACVKFYLNHHILLHENSIQIGYSRKGHNNFLQNCDFVCCRSTRKIVHPITKTSVFFTCSRQVTSETWLLFYAWSGKCEFWKL